MNLFTIPLRNLNRKLGRTMVVLFVFTLGILSMVTINRVSRVVGESLERKLNQYGANILVYPVADVLKVSYGGFDLGTLSYEVPYMNEQDVRSGILGIELSSNISAVAPKLVALEKVDGRAVAVVGVDWEEERKIKDHWMVEGMAHDGPTGIVAGATVADHMGIVAGDRVVLGADSYVVDGVLTQTGSDDDNVLFLDIHTLQAMTGRRGLVNFVEVSALCSACPIEDIVAQISRNLPGADIRTVQSQVMQRMSAVGFVTRLAGAVSMVIVLIAGFMIALFMFTSVNERKREIGLLRSVGYPRFSIFAIFCSEAVMIGAVAGFVGYLAGHFLSFEVLELLDIGSGAARGFEAGRFVFTFAIVAAVSAAASSFPAWKAARIEPSEALVAI